MESYPNQMYFTNKQEKVQINRLRFYGYKTKIPNHNTDKIANFLALKTLRKRQVVFKVNFFYKILNG